MKCNSIDFDNSSFEYLFFFFFIENGILYCSIENADVHLCASSYLCYSQLILVTSMNIGIINIPYIMAILSILSSSREWRWIDITVLCVIVTVTTSFILYLKICSRDKTNSYSIDLYRFINTCIRNLKIIIFRYITLDIIIIIYKIL